MAAGGKTEVFRVIIDEFAKKLDDHITKSGVKYLAESFSAADICVSVWLALAMKNCGKADLPDNVSKWITGVLAAIKPYSDRITDLLETLSGGAVASPATSSGKFADNPLVQKLKERAPFWITMTRHDRSPVAIMLIE